MEPEYPVGSLIYVKEIEPLEVKEGDAITFYMADSQIVATHEVYLIDEEKQIFKTQGINNRDSQGNIVPDASPVEFSKLIGKPILCIPYMGFVNRYVTTEPGLYIVLFITVMVVMISFILEYITKRNENSKNNSVKE